jgi:hypothetical protein
MRRFHLIELHEQRWFPSFLRDEITGALQFGLSHANAYAPIATMLRGAVDSSRSQAIIDLCSGAGGPWLNLAQKLNSPQPAATRSIPIRLTDKYPNLRAFEELSAASANHIGSCAQPVDAMNVPRELAGFRTMFTSFHHFAPDDARAILQDAVDARQSIGIFEVTRRAPSAIAFMLLWSIFLFLCTPWIRPFRWSRTFCTYIIPIIPAVLLFDGVVSCLRTYRPPELRAITERVRTSDYTWNFGEYYGTRKRMPITYLIGFPTTPAMSAVAAA